MKGLKKYTYETAKKLSRSSGRLIASPLKIKGVRYTLKQALKGGWVIARLAGNMLDRPQEEVANLLDEVRDEVKSTEKREKAREIPIKEPRSDASDNLSNRSLEELYEMAQKLDIQGRSEMNKGQLIRAIKEKRSIT